MIALQGGVTHFHCSSSSSELVGKTSSQPAARLARSSSQSATRARTSSHLGRRGRRRAAGGAPRSDGLACQGELVSSDVEHHFAAPPRTVEGVDPLREVHLTRTAALRREVGVREYALLVLGAPAPRVGFLAKRTAELARHASLLCEVPAQQGRHRPSKRPGVLQVPQSTQSTQSMDFVDLVDLVDFTGSLAGVRAHPAQPRSATGAAEAIQPGPPLCRTGMGGGPTPAGVVGRRQTGARACSRAT